MTGLDHDVAIVGAGPAGMAAATALSQAGISDIVVYEREAEIGGIARHTHHASYGLLVFKRPMSGPKFVAALRRRCPRVRFETSATVTAIGAGGELDVATPDGLRTIRVRHIILATGARETPRHGRLISGLRPSGVMTTGALQQHIYNAHLRPFERPVIVGTELVSFSALWTLRHASIKPVAMIEANARITAYRPAALFARALGVPIHYNATICDIADIERLRKITIAQAHSGKRDIACDGVIFSGRFVGENTVLRASHLALCPQTQLPLVDQNWLSSDPHVSVIGNTTHPADMGDQCYQEGLKAGQFIARLLDGKSQVPDTFLTISHGPGIKMTTPNMVRCNADGQARFDISFHVTAAFTGKVKLSYGGQVMCRKFRRCLPARRITLKNIRLSQAPAGTDSAIEISLTDKGLET